MNRFVTKKMVEVLEIDHKGLAKQLEKMVVESHEINFRNNRDSRQMLTTIMATTIVYLDICEAISLKDWHTARGLVLSLDTMSRDLILALIENITGFTFGQLAAKSK